MSPGTAFWVTLVVLCVGAAIVFAGFVGWLLYEGSGVKG